MKLLKQLLQMMKLMINLKKFSTQILKMRLKRFLIHEGCRFWCWKVSHVGRKISATLSSTGTPSFFIHPTEASRGDMGMIENDVI